MRRPAPDGAGPRLIAFDMDGTLLDGRLIESLASRFGFSPAVKRLLASNILPYRRTVEIAKLLRGLKPQEIIATLKGMRLTHDAPKTLTTLKSRGHVVGIISDSYTIATRHLRQRFRLDFDVANRLEVRRGFLTGKVKMPLGWRENRCGCRQSVCKSFYFKRMASRFGFSASQCVAVGDNSSDVCMLRVAGLSIAFNPKHKLVEEAADVVIRSQKLSQVLRYLEPD